MAPATTSIGTPFGSTAQPSISHSPTRSSPASARTTTRGPSAPRPSSPVASVLSASSTTTTSAPPQPASRRAATDAAASITSTSSRAPSPATSPARTRGAAQAMPIRIMARVSVMSAATTGGRLLSDLDVDLARRAAAQERKARRFADEAGQRGPQRRQVGGAGAGDTDDDVADQQSGAVGGAFRGERRHEQAAVGADRRGAGLGRARRQ